MYLESGEWKLVEENALWGSSSEGGPWQAGGQLWVRVVGKGAGRNCRFGEKEVVTMLRWPVFLCLLCVTKKPYSFALEIFLFGL